MLRIAKATEMSSPSSTNSRIFRGKAPYARGWVTP